LRGNSQWYRSVLNWKLWWSGITDWYISLRTPLCVVVQSFVYDENLTWGYISGHE
jgi:hypothetical protein